LNHELLRPFGLTSVPNLESIEASTSHFHAPQVNLPTFVQQALTETERSVVLHPKSQGSAREWPMDKYIELSSQLAERNFTVLFTGTESEGLQFRKQIPKHKHIIDTTGKLSLNELIALIGQVDALIACSTGPLHIAGYLGIHAIGFYVPRRPIHPGRWKALGANVSILVNDPECNKCKKKEDCNCIADISVERVLKLF
jgi:ADP-heptose:LPS heptosyltransferase